MPITLVKSTIAGEVGTWGPDVNGNWDAITAYVVSLELQLADRPTVAQMNTAIAAAVSLALQAF